jgi:hypothetical protein
MEARLVGTGGANMVDGAGTKKVQLNFWSDGTVTWQFVGAHPEYRTKK